LKLQIIYSKLFTVDIILQPRELAENNLLLKDREAWSFFSRLVISSIISVVITWWWLNLYACKICR
jgi:hypothetical protein